MKDKYLTFWGTAIGVFLAFAVAASAQTNFFSLSLTQGVAKITFKTNGNPSDYYVLKSSTNLPAFSPVMITFASNALAYQTPATNRQGFFSASALSIYAPEATLGDGIDDVFKLDLGLNPLSASVAGSFSGHYDSGNNPLSWLQYYTQVLGRSATNNAAIGREFSVFNFGVPYSPFEAVSREVSVHNTL